MPGSSQIGACGDGSARCARSITGASSDGAAGFEISVATKVMQ
jgi:hypothetical protein